MFNLNYAYQILESYGYYYGNYYNSSCEEEFDIDQNLTKNKIDRICINKPNLTKDDIDFLQMLLSDGDNMTDKVKEAILYIINNN